MKIVDENLLDLFRTAGPCEWCGRRCARREPHHLWAKGMGGGGRLDVPCNLIALGSSVPFPLCSCHNELHDGNITHSDMLAVVAARESMLQDEITDYIYYLRRLPKGSNPMLVLQRFAQEFITFLLPDGQRIMVRLLEHSVRNGVTRARLGVEAPPEVRIVRGPEHIDENGVLRQR